MSKRRYRGSTPEEREAADRFEKFEREQYLLAQPVALHDLIEAIDMVAFNLGGSGISHRDLIADAFRALAKSLRP